jgi:membrane-bound lytic murein transglycosylase B
MRRLLVGLALIVLLPSLTSVAAAQDGGAPPSAAQIGDARVTPSLLGLPVDSAAYRAAVAAWQKTLTDIATAQRTIASNQRTVVALETERTQVQNELDSLLVQLAAANSQFDSYERGARELAVDTYVRGGPAVEALALIDSTDVNNDIYERTLVQHVTDVQIDRTRAARTHRDELSARRADRTDRLVAIDDGLVTAHSAIDDATRRLASLSSSLPAREQAVRDRRLGAQVVGTDLTLVVLDAYAKAATRERRERPSCALEWWMIAALARIESRHGTYGGAEVLPDGRTSQPIIGIRLDGDNGTRRVPDSDRGSLDGDATLDRAVGPLQFIPSTWQVFGRDGNSDGQRDPNNIYDAALGAAAFLCGRAPTLATTAGLSAAYLAYNRSATYVQTVLDSGRIYQQLALP